MRIGPAAVGSLITARARSEAKARADSNFATACREISHGRGAPREPAVAKVGALCMNEATERRRVHGSKTAYITAECFRKCHSLRGERDVVGRDNFEGHGER